MALARYSNNTVGPDGLLPLPSVAVRVLTADNQLAALYGDDGSALVNPVVSRFPDGAFAFNAEVGVYTLVYTYAGRELLRDNAVTVGVVPVPTDLLPAIDALITTRIAATTTSQIAEGSRLYFTEARAAAAFRNSDDGKALLWNEFLVNAIARFGDVDQATAIEPKSSLGRRTADTCQFSLQFTARDKVITSTGPFRITDLNFFARYDQVLEFRGSGFADDTIALFTQNVIEFMDADGKPLVIDSVADTWFLRIGATVAVIPETDV